MSAQVVWFALIVRDTQAREIVESCCTTSHEEFEYLKKQWKKEYKKEDGYKNQARQFYSRDDAYLFAGWAK